MAYNNNRWIQISQENNPNSYFMPWPKDPHGDFLLGVYVGGVPPQTTRKVISSQRFKHYDYL